MKLKLIALAISLSLSACATTHVSKTSPVDSVTPPWVVETKSNQADTSQNLENIITLEQTMADPDWFGRAPQSWYWGDDNQTVFYYQKRVGNPITDLFKINLNKAGEGEKVNLAELHMVDDTNAVKNNEGTLEAYTFNGNVFIKNLLSKHVVQLTNTSANETAVMFLNNGNIAYQIENVFYAHNMQTNQIIELANLQMKDQPKNIEDPESYLAKEQHELIDYVSLQHRNAKLKEQHKQELQQQNSTITDTLFYFGKDMEVSYASLSPSGDKLFVSIAEAKSSRDDSDIMPNYISSDGHINAQKARSRVANNRQYKEMLYMIDLVQGEKKITCL